MSAEETITVAPAAAAPVAAAPAAASPPPETPEKKEETSTPAAAPAPETPFSKLAARLPEIIKSAAHGEMWGVELSSAEHVPTKVVLQKFLRANNGDAAAAEKQLTSALEWRKKLQPTALVADTFDESKYGGLGYVTVHKDDKGKETVITWNVYGAVKDNKKTFGDVQDFIKWRAGLMELGVQKLNLNAVTEPIPDGGEDPYQMIQVHDYMSVSFFKMDPYVKAASKETIQVMGMAYPELLAHKYFVNVPTIMGWMYAAMKLFLAPATLRKFHPMSSGTTLATELTSIVDTLPKEYGGKGESVKEVGETVKLIDIEGQPKKEDIPSEAPEAPVAAVKEGEAKEDTKVEEPKATETKPEEPKAEEPKAEEPKPTETKPDEPKAPEEPKSGEPKAEETKEEPAEETKAAEPEKKESA